MSIVKAVGVIAIALTVTRATSAETVVIRSRAGIGTAASTALDRARISDRFCYQTYCVAPSATEAQIASLRTADGVAIELLPHARKVFLDRVTYDGDLDAFDRPFPGSEEVNRSTAQEQAILLLKSYPLPAWRAELARQGLLVGEPLSPMAYRVFGPRSVVEKVTSLPYVLKVREIPAGLKRRRIDTLAPSDDGGPRSTIVSFFDYPTSDVPSLLSSATGQLPPSAFRMSSIVAYSVPLTIGEALALSAMPEVVLVTRNSTVVQPSDERANRIIAGAWQTPGTSWPPPGPVATPSPTPTPIPLPPNASQPPYYWDTYLADLASLANPVIPANQTIAFLDTGVDSGLTRIAVAGSPTPTPIGSEALCPPALTNPADGQCRLVTTNDLTEDFGEAFGQHAGRANDYDPHGTGTTAMAAGFTLGATADRDNDRYAFTQGIAQGARIAVAKIFRGCGNTPDYRKVNSGAGGEPRFNGDDFEPRLRYSLVTLSRAGILADGSFGAGASLFNHSWNQEGTDPADTLYDALSIDIDKTTRTLRALEFDFGYQGHPNAKRGSALPALHVISAGNYDAGASVSYRITTPGNAKNAVTVGGTESLNHMGYTGTANCSLDAASADIDRQMYAFSLNGHSNGRIKPDLVAPATRIYARASSERLCGGCYTTTTGDYRWTAGTSFAAPAVSGASAVVREWLSTMGAPDASPTLVKATLVAGAKNLVVRRSGLGICCADEACSHNWSCLVNRPGEQEDVRPVPDPYQGWGGLSLDRFFRPASPNPRYYFLDQTSSPIMGPSGVGFWEKYLTVTDPAEPVTIVLAWTDRFSDPAVDDSRNLLNDLDLSASAQGHSWYGNVYYCDSSDLSRRGHSLTDPLCPARPPEYPFPYIPYDRTNNLERIDIPANTLSPGTSIYVLVWAASVVADAIDMSEAASNFRQDFTLAVINAHE